MSNHHDGQNQSRLGGVLVGTRRKYFSTASRQNRSRIKACSLSEQHNPDISNMSQNLNHGDYWSRRKSETEPHLVTNPADNYWERDPDKTIAFMKEVKKPWIAFKTLAAGAIRPESGFSYAFKNGADHICVGMFDFHVERNVGLVLSVLHRTANRERPWLS